MDAKSSFIQNLYIYNDETRFEPFGYILSSAGTVAFSKWLKGI